EHPRVIALTRCRAGAGLGERALRTAAKAEGAVLNKDYAWLGYKSGFQVVMIGIGENLRGMYPVDFYGTPLDSIPVTRGVNAYRQMAMVINLSGSSATDTGSSSPRAAFTRLWSWAARRSWPPTTTRTSPRSRSWDSWAE